MKYKCLKKFGMDNKRDIKKGFLKFTNKILLTVVICLTCLIVMEYSPKFKDFINEKVLNNNISFAYFKNLYNKYFGDVLPNNNDTVSVFDEKLVYKRKESYFNGYKLEVSTNYLVPVIETGIVVYIGEKDEYGSTVVVEQIDGVNIWYGNVNTSNVKLYDYITKGTFLGEVKDNNLYIVVEKDGEYLDIETYLS